MSIVATRAVTALAGTRRAVQLYPAAHPAYGEALVELEGAVRDAATAVPFVLNVHQGRLYHDSTVLPDDVPGLGQVVETLEAFGLESMVFQPAFSASDAISLTEVLAMRPSPGLDVEAELAARGVVAVGVSVLARNDDEGTERDMLREQHHALLRRSVASVERLLEHAGAGNEAAISEARTLTRNVVGELERGIPGALALAATRNTEVRHVYHALNVMVYALIIGTRLGLPPEALESLGTAALLHDVGKLTFDPADTIQPEHPKIGAAILQRLAPIDVAPMLVAYEHHMGADGSGFPDRAEGYVAHPYSRMVMIANRYDNLVCPPAGIDPLTPDRALVQVLREAGANLDPFLARLFANTLGPFPVGSIVRLSDQSVGIVVSEGSDPLLPAVRLAFDLNGLDVTDPDLEDVDLADGSLSIVEVISPESLAVDVAARVF